MALRKHGIDGVQYAYDFSLEVPVVSETEIFTPAQFLIGLTVYALLFKVNFFHYMKYYMRINSLLIKLNFKPFWYDFHAIQVTMNYS